MTKMKGVHYKKWHVFTYYYIYRLNYYLLLKTFAIENDKNERCSLQKSARDCGLSNEKPNQIPAKPRQCKCYKS